MSIVYPTKTIQGNVEVKNGSIITSAICTKDIFPPSGNYTNHFGPMIQGVHMMTDTRAVFNVNNAVTRNGSLTYIANITPLVICINKVYPTSKIMIHGQVMAEQGPPPTNAHEHETQLVVGRITPSGTFDKEVGTPQFASTGHGIGLVTNHYLDEDEDSA